MFIHKFFLYIKKKHPNPWTALHLKKYARPRRGKKLNFKNYTIVLVPSWQK